MKRKNMFTSAVIITLSLSACISGCGKQSVAPVMAATVEKETLTYEVTTEEESVIATEEETESIQESETDETETESVTVQDFTITEMNKEMQATQNAVTFETPSADTAIGGVKQDEIVKVTGIVDGTDWYRIIGSDNIELFIDSKYLKEIEQQQTAQNENTNNDNKNNNDNNNNNQNQQQSQVQTPPVVVDPPAPQPEEDKSGGAERLPDGGIPQADGSVVYPGDVVAGGSIVVTGIGEDSSNWW